MTTKPPSLLDPTWKYIPSCETNLRERFRQIDPKWNQRPQHLEPQKRERDRINGWTK